MEKDNEIFERLGNMDGTLNEIKGIVQRTEERNTKEHDELRAEIALRALKEDVDNLGNVMRKHDTRLSTLETQDDKKIATTVRGAGKYIGIFLGSAVFMYIIYRLPDFFEFISSLTKK